MSRVVLALAALVLSLSGTAVLAADPSPRAVVEASFAAVNRHDAAGLASFYSPDAVLISSDVCNPETGPEAVRKGHEGLFKAMPDLKVEVTDWVVQGDQVAVLFTARSQGLGPAGKGIFADFLTVKGGKIVRDVTVFNAGESCH